MVKKRRTLKNKFRRLFSKKSRNTKQKYYKGGEGEAEGAENKNKDVFLGGSCNPTKWRKEIAIPLLNQYNISYYDPQVEDWYEELVQIEENAKKNAKVLLFVIDNQTRAIASMIEAAFYAGIGRKVVLVIDNFVGDETVNGIESKEFNDLNRGRKYLKGMIEKNNLEKVYIEETISSAVDKCVEMVNEVNKPL
jgi:hypothetical protein